MSRFPHSLHTDSTAQFDLTTTICSATNISQSRVKPDLGFGLTNEMLQVKPCGPGWHIYKTLSILFMASKYSSTLATTTGVVVSSLSAVQNCDFVTIVSNVCFSCCEILDLYTVVCFSKMFYVIYCSFGVKYMYRSLFFNKIVLYLTVTFLYFNQPPLLLVLIGCCCC